MDSLAGTGQSVRIRTMRTGQPPPRAFLLREQMFDTRLWDFPTSAYFRGIDIDMPGDRRKPVVDWSEPPDEHWFARLHGEEPEEPPKKAQERPWKPQIEAPRGGRDL